MIVVDASIIVYLHIRGDWSEDAELVWQRDSYWVAPLLWRSEFNNVLASYMRKGLLTLDTAQQIIKNACISMANHEYQVDSTKVLELAVHSGCTAYDCEYVVLAQELNIKLVTSDRQVLKCFPDVAISAEAFIQ
jgi:predicted nucleic acid-binding protein